MINISYTKQLFYRKFNIELSLERLLKSNDFPDDGYSSHLHDYNLLQTRQDLIDIDDDIEKYFRTHQE